MLLTGDNKARTQAVGTSLGIAQIVAEVLPEDKAAKLAQPQREGRIVAMVGVAMSTGTDVAMHAAGITLMRGDPALVPDAIDISRRTDGKIKQNILWAFVYNLIGISLAEFGFLNPVVAAAAMAFSSVSVVSNALLLRRLRPVAKSQLVAPEG